MTILVTLLLGFSIHSETLKSARPDAVSALWIGDSRGMTKVAPGTGALLLRVDTAGEVGAIAVDEWNARVWARGHHALYAFDFAGAQLLRIPFPYRHHHERDGCGPPGPVGTEDARLAVDPADGAVWHAAGEWLFRFDVQGELKVSLKLHHPIRGIALDRSKSHLWVATDRAVTAYDQEGHAVGGIELRRRSEVRDIAFDPVSGGLWIALDHFLKRYDDNGALLFEKRFHRIRRIGADGRGGLWIARERTVARLDRDGKTLFEVDPFQGREGGGPNDLAPDVLDGSAWVVNGKFLAHVSATGAVSSVFDPDAAHRTRLHAVVLYRDAAPPAVGITSPAEGTRINTSSPEIAVTYSDAGTGVDPGSLFFRVNGSDCAGVCSATDTGALCALPAVLREGENTVIATVKDYEGNVSRPAQVSFTIDTVPPGITLSAPPQGLVTNQAGQAIAGSVSEPATLTSNGLPLTLGEGLSFSGTITLGEGTNTVELMAVDRAGNNARLILNLTLDTVAPGIPDLGLIAVSDPVDGQVTVTGAAGSVEGGAEVVVTNSVTGETKIVTANADGSFTVSIGARAGETLSIAVRDKAGNSGPAANLAVPAAGSPAADKLPEGSFGYFYRDLVPRDATIAEYNPRRFGLVTGIVNDAATCRSPGSSCRFFRTRNTARRRRMPRGASLCRPRAGARSPSSTTRPVCSRRSDRSTCRGTISRWPRRCG
ncbi:hypothetical protein Sfum_4062 [Syntrophobacter fumaroxidans MPOB]|uniref:Bacterial Ig domain-containing protein n=1 Tax=Syntrophobacter fumaroxidans (strain DSM 10017 / MPOB) TaxID=335543 RepID=A0LQM6_SYNFM|nr:Ig-like domain-containing protein [Syntrophobacter fumaroxidans]ABK19728.1 hypothetical protein Sfum_4062 [Syntrophobacter fumaroxidans MPOB]